MPEMKAIIIHLGLFVLQFFAFSTLMGQNRTLVLVQPPPLVANAGEDKEIIAGDTVQLGGTPSAKDGYGNYIFSWDPAVGLDNSISPNPRAHPEISTTYILSVFDGKRCLAQDEVYVNVSPNSVESYSPLYDPIIYPNPSDGLIHIKLSAFSEFKYLNVLSTLGEVLQRKDLELGPYTDQEIDLSHLGRGMFFISLQSANRNVVQKVWIY